MGQPVCSCEAGGQEEGALIASRLYPGGVDVRFTVHQKQAEVLQDDTRFKVFGAGRRSGKTYLAAIWLYLRAIEEPRPGVNYGPASRVLYVAPTISMADDLMYEVFAAIAENHIDKEWRSRLRFRMTNGRIVQLAGCDRPRTLRGGSLIALCLDECQDIDLPEVWDRVLRPACGDLKAPVLFCGTPLPHLNFPWTELYRRGESDEHPEWKSFHCNSTDNPFIDMQSEVDQARRDGVAESVIQQEYYASFDLINTTQFPLDNLPKFDQCPEGFTFVTFDLQGFSDISSLSIKEIKRLDRTAVVAVTITPDKHWYIRQLKVGRWKVDETAEVIADFIKRWQPLSVGCEKGALFNAIRPYLLEALRRRNMFIKLEPLSNAGTSKANRILWALQGRFEQNMIHFPAEWPEWCDELVRELMSFPSTAAHDDTIDALAFIDQFADRVPEDGGVPFDEWEEWDDGEYVEPIDDVTGI